MQRFMNVIILHMVTEEVDFGAILVEITQRYGNRNEELIKTLKICIVLLFSLCAGTFQQVTKSSLDFASAVKAKR